MLEKQGEKQWGLGGDGHSLLEPSEVYPETGLCPDQLSVWFMCVYCGKGKAESVGWEERKTQWERLASALPMGVDTRGRRPQESFA